MIGRAFVLAVGLISGAVSAEPRQPSEKWIVNFADAQCIASRNYGSDSNPLYLVLKAPATGAALQLGIVRKGSKSTATQADGEIIINNSSSYRTSLLEFGSKGSNQRALLANIPASQLSGLRNATTIQIRARGSGITTTASRVARGGGGGADETFAVTQMQSLLRLLDNCTADLRKVWHVWTEEGESPDLKEGAKANLTNIFSADDYPDIALFKEQMGTVVLVLLVDELGKVADCTTVETSGVAALDAQSCAIVKERARFSPPSV
jgi:TonB family protein